MNVIPERIIFVSRGITVYLIYPHTEFHMPNTLQISNIVVETYYAP